MRVFLVDVPQMLGRVRARVQSKVMAISAQLYREGLEALAYSQEIVPVDTGALRSTGHCELPATEGDQIVVSLGYGGPAVRYARKVHDDPSARHTAPTRWKFLEEGVLSRVRGMRDRLADAARRA